MLADLDTKFHMFRKRRKSSNSGEDGAGWIYADLFLALMIVGLAAPLMLAPTSVGGVCSTEAFQRWQQLITVEQRVRRMP